MKKASPIILIVFISLGLSTLCQAQDTTQAVQPHELGSDISPIFAGITGINVPGIVYRRHYEKGAFRLRLNFSGGNYKQTTTTTNTNGNTSSGNGPYNSFGFTLRSGYQWNHNWDKCRLYYGLDALFSYSKYYSQISNINNSSPPAVYTNEQEQKSSGKSWGVVPFTGFTYRFNPKFSLSAEAGLNFAFYRNTSETTLTNFIQSDPNTPSTNDRSINNSTSNGFSYYFLPVSVLISYHF